MNQDLLRVLDAREERWNLRNEIAARTGKTLISISFCVPEKFRTNPEFLPIFEGLCAHVEAGLTGQGVHLTREGSLNGADGPALFYSAEEDPLSVKKLCVAAEETLPGGRMLDVDLMAPDGTPISRKDVGAPARSCFVCDRPAAECVSRKLHSKADVAARVEVLAAEARAFLGL